MKVDADLFLYDKHMGGDELTVEELKRLADWLQAEINKAILLGDGNLAEWYASVLLTVCKD